MTVPVPVENGGITPEDDARMHSDIAEFLQRQEELGADPEVLADIGYKPLPGPEEAEDVAITPEDERRMHREVADFLLEQIAAGAEPEDLEDLGHTEIPEPGEGETGSDEERAEAAERSGRLLVTREVAAPASDRPAQRRQRRPRSQHPQGPKFRKRPRARTSREKMARDRAVGDSKKPWPYGSKED